MIAALHPHAVVGLRRRNRAGLQAAVLFLAAAVLAPFASHASHAAASGTAIHISSAQYNTRLLARTTGDPIEIEENRKTTSIAPVSDHLEIMDNLYAEADADKYSLAVTAVASNLGNRARPYAEAAAQTVWNFSPLQDGQVPLTFELAGSVLSMYSYGAISLRDLTTDESVFLYSWTYSWQGNVPWEPRTTPGWSMGASLAPAPDLLASHEYALSFHATANASTDGQSLKIDLSGVHSVPEPAAGVLMLLGAGLVGCVRGLRERVRGRRAVLQRA